MDWLYAVTLGYLLGSVPFGLILTRLFGAGDLRSIGSGNIGATNVLRTGRKGLAAATLLLDGAKGFIAIVLAWELFGYDGHLSEAIWGPVPAAALGVVLGHCFPVWLKFKGGKGVATNAGVAFGLAWPLGVAYAVIWLGLVIMTRISSLAGMCAVIGAAIAAAAFGFPHFVPVLTIIALLVLWLHRANIARLRAGTEPKIGQKSI